MTDLEQFVALLNKCKPRMGHVVSKPGDDNFEFAKDNGTLGNEACAIRVHVMPGYRCHFEAEFDAEGNILNMAQWDEM